MNPSDQTIIAGLQRALDAAARKDWSTVERVREDLASIVAHKPGAAAHYALGRVLLLQKSQSAEPERLQDAAQAAFSQALALDPRHVPSHYSLGTLLAARGREAEAMAHWEKAVAADPGHVDALYNLGQAHYGRGEYAAALARWQAAHQHEPQDVEILKKIVQAHHALEQYDEAEQTLGTLVALCRASSAAGAVPSEIVIDQFRIGPRLVFAYRSLVPPTKDLDYVYTFKLFEPSRKVLMTVQLESSAYSRERGVPYLLGMTRPTGHCLLGPSFSSLPPYSQLKPLALAALREHGAN